MLATGCQNLGRLNRKLSEVLVHEERLDNIHSRQQITTGLCLCCSHTTKSAFLDRDRNTHLMIIRHFSVAPYITICLSTETYFGLYLRRAMSAVTGIYLFRLLLNIIFFALRSFFTLPNSEYPDEMPHDGISTVSKCKKHVPKNIFQD